MKKIALLVTLFATWPVGADYKFGFADVSVNRLTWTAGTKEKSPRKADFTYLEAEGGANFSWGEVYGFFDYENPGRAPDQTRTAAKGTVAVYLGDLALSAYAQVYNFAADGFSEQNQVFGLQYQFNSATWWFRPFLGFHQVVQTFYTGANGYMAGWTLGYAFSLCGLKLLFADWHEFEFERNPRYADTQGGGRTGHNGAASIWWNATQHFATGFQWRYGRDKLGTPGDFGAEIYTLKYNF